MVDGVCGEGTAPCPPLPQRDEAGHKGTFGRVLVVGGCARLPRMMLGGAVLAARAAIRAGCGLAELAVPEPLAAAALASLESATGHALPVDAEGNLLPSACAEVIDPVLARCNAAVVGPALGEGFAVEQVVVRFIAHADVPLIVDADALNALARLVDFARDMRGGPVVMTPHPGEFRRLAQTLDIDGDPIGDGAGAAAAALAQRCGCVVVLKGARTSVSDGIHAWSCHAGTAALATGGSGDALSGVIAAFAAQFMRPPHAASLFDCARWGVAVHGLAAQRWSSRHGSAGMLTTELCDLVPDVLGDLRAA
ncbi:MAG: NAD(P)H-hydrate dehydratase [Planctomycetes bacterium]|nr:NAD(P)H-hydrate dehydratase [Planctomycetota bacterium]